MRDRAVGERLGASCAAWATSPSTTATRPAGPAWWNEVVGRIESSDVFVAVVSPSYAEAQTCRLAAKHAAASGLRRGAPRPRRRGGQRAATRWWRRRPGCASTPTRPRGPWLGSPAPWMGSPDAAADRRRVPRRATAPRGRPSVPWSPSTAVALVAVVGWSRPGCSDDDGPDRGTDQVAPATQPPVTATPEPRPPTAPRRGCRPGGAGRDQRGRLPRTPAGLVPGRRP